MNSIGLGEDGPTHQPVEHFAALRAIPNLLMFRPADAMEAAECWAAALAAEKTPSILCLSRQGLPALAGARRSRRKSQREGRLRDPRTRGAASGDDPGDRLRNPARSGGGEGIERGRHRRGGGIHAELGAVPQAERGLSQIGAGRGAARRGRSRGAVRLGRVDRPRWRVHRHDGLRRVGTGGRAVQAFRHHRRGGHEGCTRRSGQAKLQRTLAPARTAPTLSGRVRYLH